MSTPTISRIWHGKTRAEHADINLNYVIDTGLFDYRAAAGNLSAKIRRPLDGDTCHFLTITEWASFPSSKQFAG